MGNIQREVTRKYYTKLVGCTFRNEGENTESRQSIISDLFRRGMLTFGQELRLVPEPNNRYDSHAVAVFGPDGRQLGYLGRDLAYDVFVSIQSGKKYSAYVESVNGGNGYSYGISMRVEEYKEVIPKPIAPPKPQYSEEQANADYQLALVEYNEQSFTPTMFARFEKAAKYGLADAQYLYACCFDFGRGTYQDEAQAAIWYEKAAKQGHASAQADLAIDYLNGIGVHKDPSKAFFWANKSAEQNDSDGLVILGRMYEKGQGIEQNYVKAYEAYRKAAELGNVNGANNVGICYLAGCGCDKNPSEAARWNRIAAEAGHPTAQFNLANQYLHGDGVPEDQAIGAEWFFKAAQNGHPQAAHLLKELGYM